MPNHGSFRNLCVAALLAPLVVCSCEKRVTWPASQLKVADPHSFRQLIFGFYDPLQFDWRWTAPEFAVALGPPLKNGVPSSDWSSASLQVDLYFPPDEIERLGSITMSATSPGFAFEDVTFDSAGPHLYVSAVPPKALCTNLLPVKFTLNKFMRGSGADSRDLGAVVTSIRLTAQ